LSKESLHKPRRKPAQIFFIFIKESFIFATSRYNVLISLLENSKKRFKFRAMITFSSSEKIAILSLLKAMLLADGKVDIMESSMMAAVMEKLDISQAETILSDSIEPTDAAKVIAQSSLEKKKIVCGLLGTMMAADKDIDPKEALLWGLLSKTCGFPTMNVGDAMLCTKEFFDIE